MSYFIKNKKMINIFSDGSFLMIKNVFSNKLNFLEKDFKNSGLWIKTTNLNIYNDSKINRLEYRNKFFNKKIKN
jgi:hypothetical protein